ncbi:MAG: M20 family metallo-hydrolase [Alistipes sp.]|jgi:acetylornithine deacetylase|nr:M20 family metallo-hydrolase [Alistipes sp.]
MTHKELYEDAVALLQKLVATSSFSREEEATALIIKEWLESKGIDDVRRHNNNVWVNNLHFDAARPTILLCSHHDTVRPTAAWTRDPFSPTIEADEDARERLYGLGSNDAGASVVSLAAAFRHFYDRKDLKYNLILTLVGEEEISGPGGVRSILPQLGLDEQVRGTVGALDFAIVGEPTMQPRERELAHDADEQKGGDGATQSQPTRMQLAVAERGLMVLDCVAHGVAGHAARDEGDNAIYRAMSDIEWLRTYRFPRKSPLFGEVKMSVTIIAAGTQHNVVPAECRFTVDCRVTEQYTNEEVLEAVRQNVKSEVTPRSVHLRSSSISLDHPIVEAGIELGMSTFGSPTTSDQVALTHIPSVKVGPGLSARSHSADEYVELAEVEEGINMYIKLLEKILF